MGKVTVQYTLRFFFRVDALNTIKCHSFYFIDIIQFRTFHVSHGKQIKDRSKLNDFDQWENQS